MYDKRLDTFIELADSGSLSRAGDNLYLSKQAVLKQINSLEEYTGVKLFIRSHSGFALTREGQAYYNCAKEMIALSEKSILQIHRIGNIPRKRIRIGSSFLNPAESFFDFWKRIHPQYPSFELEICPFDDSTDRVTQSIASISKSFDFFCGLYDTVGWYEYCRFLRLKDCIFCAAVSEGHPLAARKAVSMEELGQYPVILPAYQTSPSVSVFEDDLCASANGVRIIHTKANYDLNIFNSVINTDQVLISFDCWKDLHPSLVTIPVKTQRKIPFGLVYGKNANEDVLSFVRAVKEYLNIRKDPFQPE